MKLTPWMKALVWLGLGGGIGFFAGFRIGYIKDKKDIITGCNQTLSETRAQERAKETKFWERQLDLKDAEIREIKRAAQEALKAQREYFGAKDDEILDDADDSVMEEIPEMPEDPFPDYGGDNDGDSVEDFIRRRQPPLAYAEEEDEEIQQLHPEDLRPYAITPDEFMRNEKGYDKIELDYYTEDCVIFDPHREEKWTHPEQLLGIGWKERFNSYGGNDIREIYVQNDTMEILYKITRIEDSFERLYEEE